MTQDQVLAEARKRVEKIAEDSCAMARTAGWKMRWEWRGNSIWLIDETEQPATETELLDIVPIEQAMGELACEGGRQ